MTRKLLLWGLIIIATLGVIDAGFLTYEHYAGGIPPCTINGCETVLTSPYATLMGFPISLLGVLFYISVFFAAFVLLRKENHFLRVFLLASTSAGFLFSSYLFYLQAQVLGAFCQYCLFSFGTATLLFLLSLSLFLKRNTESAILNP